MYNPSITIICGPTASGKSAIAMELAKNTNGVIINSDSCQIYRGLDVLTSSPSISEKSQIEHRLYNFLDLNDNFSVIKYLDIVKNEIENVFDIGKHPIITGGTGFYIDALLNGISKIPDVDEGIISESREQFELMGKEAFYKRLVTNLPEIANHINSGDSHRMIRAYAVFRQTNKSITHYRNNKIGGIKYKTRIIVVTPEREFLYRSCNERFQLFMQRGAIEEVKNAMYKYRNVKILGFQEIASFLDGSISLDDAVRIGQMKTRQYAKRQTTWFKNKIKGDIELSFSSVPEFKAIVSSLLR